MARFELTPDPSSRPTDSSWGNGESKLTPDGDPKLTANYLRIDSGIGGPKAQPGETQTPIRLAETALERFNRNKEEMKERAGAKPDPDGLTPGQRWIKDLQKAEELRPSKPVSVRLSAGGLPVAWEQ